MSDLALTRPALASRDRRALAIGGAALAMLICFAFVVRPSVRGLKADRGQLAERRELLERERTLLASAPQLPAIEREARKALALETPRLFVGDSVAATAELNTYVSQVAAASGLRLLNVDGRPASVDGGLVQVGVDVRGEGTWRQILAYVRALESSTRLVRASRVRLDRGARGGPLGGEMITLSATLIGYAGTAP